jgi:23S rRNA (uracil1939-C5)-methyltransferase
VSTSATLTIDRLAAGGDGIARHNGLAVFVPRTVPGDTATVALHPQKTFARGRVLSIVTPSPDRVPPQCVHYERDQCGGCQIQGMSYSAQLVAKGAIIRDALARIARRDVAEVQVGPSPEEWQYRNALSCTVQVDRTRPEGFVAGFHVLGDPTHVFSLERCELVATDVMRCWQELTPQFAMLPRAATLRVTVRRLADDGAMAVHVEGGRKWDRRSVESMVQDSPAVVACWWTPADGPRKLMVDRRTTAAAGASFAQVNPPMAAALQQHVLSLIESRAESHIVDAYAGSGDLSVALASRGVRVTAIELDADAAALASDRMTAAGAREVGSRVVVGRVEAHLAAALPASLVVLNPPRSGLHERVPALLANAAVTRIIYISCDPATLARDLARLGARWSLSRVDGFDMFPQTAHVETVCLLEARDA